MPAETDARTTEGRFTKGQSGNPAGRPKGARNKSTLIVEGLEGEEAEAIRRKWVEKALAGDRVALRFFAERLWPKPKGRPIELDLAEGDELDPSALVKAQIRAVADGEVTPDEALAVTRMRLVTTRIGKPITLPSRTAPAEPDAAAACISPVSAPPRGARADLLASCSVQALAA